MPDFSATIGRLHKNDAVARLWSGDHTLWNPNPTEITNRLGWLNLPVSMAANVGELSRFAREVVAEGVKSVVLLGMGGSGLGPLVLSETFSSQAGFPNLVVLDSTVPAWVNRVSDAINPRETLFLVSSKSGGTLETNTLYAHFRQLVEVMVGEEGAGRHFVAVTDAGTPLEELARKERFRRVFHNHPDVGGRYSVLSFFGLVPAALLGLDGAKLLESAAEMRSRCMPAVMPRDNPGVQLGTIMGKAALDGRDKLTLVTSPSVSTFGSWVEQMVAESTGKDGKGIVPVVGEPMLAPEYYGQDRLFVYMRLAGDDNAANDAGIAALELAGHPVLRTRLADLYDLGAEFFRWELATSIVGVVLNVNPFDQPDVAHAKQITQEMLGADTYSGGLPGVEVLDSLQGLMSEIQPRDYLSIMAYTDSTPDVVHVLTALRAAVAERYKIATTLGYGNRLMHSTGQLHKGGPNSGLFLQLTARHCRDIKVPGQPYTFGFLSDAQALGDLLTLQSKGRRVARIELDDDVVSGVLGLLAEFV